MAGGQIVEHDHALAGIGKLHQHHAADIARSAGDQDRHVPKTPWLKLSAISVPLGRGVIEKAAAGSQN